MNRLFVLRTSQRTYAIRLDCVRNMQLYREDCDHSGVEVRFAGASSEKPLRITLPNRDAEVMLGALEKYHQDLAILLGNNTEAVEAFQREAFTALFEEE